MVLGAGARWAPKHNPSTREFSAVSTPAGAYTAECNIHTYIFIGSGDKAGGETGRASLSRYCLRL